jgi:chromosome segregation ATPase
MLWLMVFLILGSIGFGASTIMQYKTHLDAIQPKIKRAKEAAEKLEKGVEVETKRKHADEKERAAVQKKIMELKSRGAEIRRSIGESTKVQEELEMAMYKKEFKKAK